MKRSIEFFLLLEILMASKKCLRMPNYFSSHYHGKGNIKKRTFDKNIPHYLSLEHCATREHKSSQVF